MQYHEILQLLKEMGMKICTTGIVESHELALPSAVQPVLNNNRIRMPRER